MDLCQTDYGSVVAAAAVVVVVVVVVVVAAAAAVVVVAGYPRTGAETLAPGEKGYSSVAVVVAVAVAVGIQAEDMFGCHISRSQIAGCAEEAGSSTAGRIGETGAGGWAVHQYDGERVLADVETAQETGSAWTGSG